MKNFTNKNSKKLGLPPGSLVHIGKRKSDRTKIMIITYNKTQFQEKEVQEVEECFHVKSKSVITWINIDGIHQTDTIKRIGKYFNLHPLVMEDIVNTQQRPKMEEFEDYIFIVLKIPYYKKENKRLQTQQISLVLGKNFVISFQETERGLFNPIKERLKSEGSRIREYGADYLAYALIDMVVDTYFLIIEEIEKKSEDIEEKLITDSTSQILHNIHTLKRETLFLRKSVWPLRDVISNLEKGESLLIKENTRIYFRDVYDHAVRVIDAIEIFRETIVGMVDIYLSSVSNRLNKTMMLLTIIGTIFIPLTFITGIYGMNFRHMPEIYWRWGYPVILLVMLAIGTSMLIYFKKKKWF